MCVCVCSITFDRNDVRHSHLHSSPYLGQVHRSRLYADVKSIDFVVTRFLMKLFRTSNIDIINDCRSNFSFMLPSEMIEIRKAKFEGKVNICNSLRYHFVL